MEIWHFAQVTTSGQPILEPNEKDILIDQYVGLYQGKSKIIQRQRGRVILTSQRIIYIDDLKPLQNSLYLNLEDVERVEYSSRFLKRSARLIVFFKNQPLDARKQSNEPRNSHCTWVCPICMVTNEMEGQFTKNTDPPPICINCGIPADYEMTKSSISSSVTPPPSKTATPSFKDKENVCPACTFINHPEITTCEICGAQLPLAKIRSKKSNARFKDSRLHIQLEESPNTKKNNLKYIQLSFRRSDGMLFYQATEKILAGIASSSSGEVFNKDLASINGVPVNNISTKDLPYLETKLSKVGIATLEKSRENQLLNNDILLNTALTDLNKLMSLANEIERLYKNYKCPSNEAEKNARREPFIITDRQKFYNKSLFLDEIAREIYGFAISEFKDTRDSKKRNIIVTLVDLYAMYNKSMRIGIGFVSPQEMKEACGRFENLGLHELSLTKLNGRVLCLSSRDSFMRIREEILQVVDRHYGCDLLKLTQTINEMGNYSLTIGIVTEILQNCIDEGDLVVDEQMSGICYYINKYWHEQEMGR